MTPFLPSSEQSAFFHAVSHSQSSILLEACAGSGKTTTIVYATSLLSPHVLTVFLAFNKRIAEELESRVPRFIQVGTFHSRCLRALTRTLPKSPKISKDKIHSLLKANLKWSDFEMYGSFVSKLVSLAKSAGLGTSLMPDTPEAWETIIAHHALTLDSPEADLPRAISIACNCLAASNSDLTTLDFDDMLYLALLRNVNFDKASNIFVDEAQDTNGVQRALLKKMGNFLTEEQSWIESKQPDFVSPSSSRLFAVGDPHQAIYGFRGADSNSLAAIAADFSCQIMPLSISFRCSQAVAKEAQKYLS